MKYKGEHAKQYNSPNGEDKERRVLQLDVLNLKVCSPYFQFFLLISG